MAQARNEPAKDPASKDTSELPEGPLEYRPKRGLHITKAGPVALGNWIGRVEGRRVRVYRGAQERGIPPQIRTAMAASGVAIGVVTPQDLGMIPRETTIVNLGQSGNGPLI